MKSKLISSAAVVGVMLLAPAAAHAGSANGPLALLPQTPTQRTPVIGSGLPQGFPATMTGRPGGFTTNGYQALASAEASAEMQAIHSKYQGTCACATPLKWVVQIWFGRPVPYWLVYFLYKNKPIAEVDVSPFGRVLHVWTGPLAITPWARGNYGRLFDSPWVFIPFVLMFLVPFVDPRRPFRMLHLDMLVLLSFGISYVLFDQVIFEPAVLSVYPPMLYLLARMLWIGTRDRRLRTPVLPRLPVWVLALGLTALIGARIGVDVASDSVMDVGYATVIGAHKIARNETVYGPKGIPGDHADTYGPVTYLAYVPFEQLFPWRGIWDNVNAGHAAAIAFDLLTIAALVALGMRLRAGREGRRLGLTLGWAWAAFPFTLLGLMKGTNDGLVAMLAAFSLLAFARPIGRGIFLGLAAAAKFSPAALLPLYMAGRRDRGVKEMFLCAIAFAATVELTIVPFLPSGGWSEFYDRTIGYQLGRVDTFSVWGLHPSLAWLHTTATVAVVVLAAALFFVPRQRSFAQIAALGAAVMIAVQLPAEHWFYLYIVWFMPFALVALFARDHGPVADAEPLAEPVAAAA